MKKTYFFIVICIILMFVGCDTECGENNSSTTTTTIKYSIMFNANGGRGEMARIEMKTNKVKKLPACTIKASSSSKMFGYWNTEKDGSGVTFADQAEVKNLINVYGATVVLYAIWIQKSWYVNDSGNICYYDIEFEKTSMVTVLQRTYQGIGTPESILYLDSDEDDYYKGVFYFHRFVTLSPYRIGQYEVTQKLYEAVMNTDNGYDVGCGDNYPAYYVSWYDAITFCNKLSILMGKTPCYSVNTVTDWENLAYSDIPTGKNTDWDNVTVNMQANGYRLPTEAEWEFAARGGELWLVPDWTFAFSGIDIVSGNKINYSYFTDANLEKVGWYGDASNFECCIEVGTLQPNRLGIYDMSGNIYEWCYDWYNDNVTINDSSYKDDKNYIKDPLGASNGERRVQRGGSYCNDADMCCVSTRQQWLPYNPSDEDGFRLVCSGAK